MSYTFSVERATGTAPGIAIHAYDDHTEEFVDGFVLLAKKPLGEQLILLAEWAIGLDELT